MRIVGFCEKWDKLQQDEFTTFRFTRKDKDWQVGEIVKVVYNPRSKSNDTLGIAEIISKEPRDMLRLRGEEIAAKITDEEVRVDGFDSIGTKPAYYVMWEWLFDTYGYERLAKEPMNKLTLRWIKCR